jgi:broad specificity phosphatase PhoE
MYLIRHGATDNNTAVPPKLQGRRIDVGLSAEGRTQACLTAEFLAPMRLDAVYSSPLLRALQTAETIAGPHDLAVGLVPELIEVDIGQWEGRDWQEIQQTDAEAYRAFWDDPAANPYLGGESLQDVADRAVPAFERLLAENAGRTIAVVAHNIVNRAYLAVLLDLPLSRYRSILQDNCGVNVIRCHQRRARLVSVNSVFHLGSFHRAPPGGKG